MPSLTNGFRRLTAVSSMAVASMFVAGTMQAATIDLGTLLTNPSFESGNQANGCPVGYTCTGNPGPGFTTYTPTSAQYTAGSDGLSGGKIAPGGTVVAVSPGSPNFEGSGTLFQGNLGNYASGNTYTISFWVGTPLKETDNTTPNGAVGTITAYFTGNGGGQLMASGVTVPAVGQWQMVTLSYTPNGVAIGQSIGFELFVDGTPVGGGSANNRTVNFDMGSAVPEPSSLLLGGLGVIGLGLIGRRRYANR